MKAVKLPVFKSSEIEEEISVCPYCGDPQGRKSVCCGEIHFTPGYLINGDVYTEDEVSIEDEKEEAK